MTTHTARNAIGRCESPPPPLTCVVAEPLPLLPPPVQPDAESHQDDPAGPPDPGDEGGLLHHVGDLLRDAVVPVSPEHDHFPEVLPWREREKGAVC